MDEQGCHNPAQERPDADAQEHAEDGQPTIQCCHRILLAIACMHSGCLCVSQREAMLRLLCCSTKGDKLLTAST